MQSWKKALVCTAVGAGTLLALSGRRNLGVATIAGGLALLASEYPERFEAVWRMLLSTSTAPPRSSPLSVVSARSLRKKPSAAASTPSSNSATNTPPKRRTRFVWNVLLLLRPKRRGGPYLP